MHYYMRTNFLYDKSDVYLNLASFPGLHTREPRRGSNRDELNNVLVDRVVSAKH